MLYYRCAEGHIFQLSASSRLLSLHLGSDRIGRCPVDRKWGRIKTVNSNELTDDQIESARRGKGGRG